MLKPNVEAKFSVMIMGASAKTEIDRDLFVSVFGDIFRTTFSGYHNPNSIRTLWKPAFLLVEESGVFISL
jgi:hypothetical protein